MGRLFDSIKAAIADDRFFASWHADERCEEREISAWQLAIDIESAELVRERPRSKPYPSVVVQQDLEDGTLVEVVWAWLAESQRAKLVTVYFPE